MDVPLAGIDGVELTGRLKSCPAARNITILGSTACAMKGDEEKSLAAGCDGYIAKSVVTRTLPRVIHGHLEL